jgi:hypothetical protein
MAASTATYSPTLQELYDLVNVKPPGRDYYHTLNGKRDVYSYGLGKFLVDNYVPNSIYSYNFEGDVLTIIRIIYLNITQLRYGLIDKSSMWSNYKYDIFNFINLESISKKYNFSLRIVERQAEDGMVAFLFLDSTFSTTKDKKIPENLNADISDLVESRYLYNHQKEYIKPEIMDMGFRMTPIEFKFYYEKRHTRAHIERCHTIKDELIKITMHPAWYFLNCLDLVEIEEDFGLNLEEYKKLCLETNGRIGSFKV